MRTDWLSEVVPLDRAAGLSLSNPEWEPHPPCWRHDEHDPSCGACRWPGYVRSVEVKFTEAELFALWGNPLHDMTPEYVTRIVELGRLIGMLPHGSVNPPSCLRMLEDPRHVHKAECRRVPVHRHIANGVLYRYPDGRRYALLSQERDEPVAWGDIPHRMAFTLRSQVSPYGAGTSAVIYLGSPAP